MEVKKQLQELVEISRFFGNKKEYAIAGGGNTSWKNEKEIFVKARGARLGTIDENGFVGLSRGSLNVISTNKYSQDDVLRETEVKQDMIRSMNNPESGKIPSVETSIHNLIDYAFVVHTHPTLINGMLCSKNARETSKKLFNDEALYIEYKIPGYDLFKSIEEKIAQYRNVHSIEPKILLLENHGVFVGADSIEEVKALYGKINEIIQKEVKDQVPEGELEINPDLISVLPAIRAIFSKNSRSIVRIRNNKLVHYFLSDESKLNSILKPFILDEVSYCKADYFVADFSGNSDTHSFLNNFQKGISEFEKSKGFLPSLLLIKGMGLISVGKDYKSANEILDVFEDQMKISYYSQNFGGPEPLSRNEIEPIYRREASEDKKNKSLLLDKPEIVKNKIIVVTGGAQGFGQGIVEELYKKGANVILADINEEKGLETANAINCPSSGSVVKFVLTDVSSPESFENLVFETVKEFGGVDAFISNAGILRAGNLTEMDPDTFDLMTRINYSAYFYGTRAFNPVFMLQNQFNKSLFFDVIQINSKSGLRGSNKNFAYAGGKFGGIGLTQSFALEMMPYNVKVNSICPGNFFDGPLWADPENGLFVQYLQAGKVKGAKNIEDVKKFYESQVPANRGCMVEDVMKAIYYIMDQEYETGQAVPVTGGQNMLN
jgi:NAD(P)-dependent dehydrogenase (short-subunit alcohol dehydrogenase family)/rhamnose utilization protein RhaD (predicted bifunctional aldolase and dehydrogenase)